MAPSSSAPIEQRRVLVVESNRNYLGVLARRIGEAGYRVATAENAQRAMAELRRVLRPGGRLQLADVTIQRPVSEEGKRNIDLWTG